jgi:hypothetical protein
MAQLIHEHSVQVRAADGRQYRARVFGERRSDGTWMGWLEFVPVGSSDGKALRTGQETSQPDRQAVEYWAGGLEPVYLEGALARAKGERRGSLERREPRELR